MHGEKVLFIENRSKKHNVPSKYVKYPNLNVTSFYSRALDMKILCRVSKTAMWMIEQEYGGFDEYILTVPDMYVNDHIARIYRSAVREEYENKKNDLRNEMLDLLQHYGPEYVLKLKAHDWKMDNILLKQVDQVLKRKNAIKHDKRLGLLPMDFELPKTTPSM
jgi:ribosomal protein L28